MAQFYGEVAGDRGTASRIGSKNSGMRAHIRGWNTGVRVELSHDGGVDYVRVYETGGSNGRKGDRLLASFGEHAS